MANDGTVKIGTELDDSGFRAGLSKLGGVAKGALIGVTASVGAASASIGVLAKKSLDAYASYEQLVGGVETLFKDSASTVQAYAANAYKTAGVSANSYMEQATAFSASLIQSLGGDTKAAAEYANQAIMDMSDNANKMGTDIEIIQQTYQSLMRGNYAMLDNLKLGYGGTKAELERLVADASELTGKALDPTKFSDVITAINAIQTNLGITGTTALEASTTIEGSVNAAKAAFENLITGIADSNADLDTLIDNFVSSVSTAAQNILPRLSEILSGIGQLISQLAPIISEQLPALITTILPSLLSAGAQIVVGLVQGVVTAAPQLLEAIPSIIQSIVTALQDSAPDIMAAGSEFLTMLGDGIIEGAPLIIERLPDLILQIIEGIRANLPTVLEVGTEFLANFIDGVFAELPTFISRLPEIVSAFYDFILSSLPQIVEAGGEILISLASGIIQSLPQLVAQIPAIIAAFVGGIASNIGPIIESGYNLLIQFANAIISNIGYLISQAPQLVQAVVSGIQNNIYQIVQVGRNIIEGLWNGIGNAAGWLKSKIQGLAGDVVQWAKDVLGIKSPSRVFREQIGKNIGLGLAAGIDASKDDALKAADELAKSVYTKSKEWLDKQVKYQEYGLREQLEVWQAIQDQFISSSQQYADAEEEILDIRHQILQENLDLEEEYQKRLSDLSQDILDSYKLFEEVPEAQAVAGQDLINNLQNQVNSIESFYSALDELYSRGVGEDLVNEIKNMGVDAADQLNALLALSDDQLNEYAELYREKQKLANDLAIEELADLRAQTDDEIQKNLDALEGKFEQESPDVGEALPEGLAKGITNGQKTVIAATVAVATAAIKAAKDTFDISAATSRITSELERAMPDAAVSVASANARMASVSVPQFSMENAITRAAGMISLSQGTQEREIVLQVNGREFARAVVPDIRAVESQSPAIVYS